MRFPMQAHALFASALFAAACAPVLAADPPAALPAAQQQSRQVIADSCASGPYQGVVTLRNRDAVVGGYVLIPTIRDSPIRYLDHEGRHLATFHIFSSNESKQQASVIIDRLRSQFPVEEFAKCEGVAR